MNFISNNNHIFTKININIDRKLIFCSMKSGFTFLSSVVGCGGVFLFENGESWTSTGCRCIVNNNFIIIIE